MLLPYKTNLVPRKTPYANYILIAANVFIFLLSYYPHTNPLTQQQEYLRGWAEYFVLNTGWPKLWQFVSYAFLHGGFLHILGNMFFLYLFGNNVNDKLGNVGYLAFYLASAVFSGTGHLLIGGGNVIGASGAVAAVTGAYLVLFPQTLISVLYWFFFIGVVEVPALYFIALKMIILDNVILRYSSDVAYDAHISGYAFGILSMVGMLAAGLISSSHFDLWAMLRQWNRRRRYRDAVAAGFDPFNPATSAKRVKVKEVKKTSAQQKAEEKTQRLRVEIGNRIYQRNLPAAAVKYLELIEHDSNQIIPRDQLLDIANQLAGENKQTEAADAYEKFLTHYGNYEYTDQVELMLGLLYSRYLKRSEAAIKHLKAAEQKLTDPAQLKMCKDELAGLQG